MMSGALDRDIERSTELNAKLQGMAEALGLTKQEIAAIKAECGA